ncbi:DUF2946 family protein [Acinetobacter tianfuensis]|uniref:DUF2946 family protein n=1 Tax=Acinetobacter tianfuensis TaxID=2419603 RepID=UPI001D191A7F|nr:DUF2946 family protein [Acinetobacter tianfuensis]
MLFRSGLLFSFTAVFLQIAVFLQPLLPKQYQIAPVCETITRALLTHTEHSAHSLSSSSDRIHGHLQHTAQHEQVQISGQHSHDHDAGHQCQYCKVFGNLVLPPELKISEVLVRIQVRLIAFVRTFAHVWFQLQRLFLLPQGRAPPLFA